MSDEFALLDGTAQAELVKTNQVHPRELVDSAIARIEKHNPVLNAVIHERFEKARIEAESELPQGPFMGVPMVVKDLDGVTKDDPAYFGTKHLKDLQYNATHDSYLQAKFRQAGTIFLGRTNTPELGLVPTTEPESYGPTRNPWDTTRSTGGSSGGSAAAVASGMVAIGHAGDGGGSIRVPASECGLVGLKPSRGRVSLGPEAGQSWGGFVARLALTRTVRDTAKILDAVSGMMPGDPYGAPLPLRPYSEEVETTVTPLRIGVSVVCGDPMVTVDPEVAAVVQEVAKQLESCGHHVAQSHPDVWDDTDFSATYTGHFINAFGVWTAGEIEKIGEISGVPVTENGVEAGTWFAAELGRGVTALSFHQALEFFNVFNRRMASWWEGGYDILITPTIPELPLLLGQFTSSAENPLQGLMRAASVVPFTAPFNTTGQPAISLPLGQSKEGLPIGVQCVAKLGREDLLIQLAGQLERAMPWSERRPPIFG